MPVASRTSSYPVKRSPNFKSFRRLAPSMTGTARKNVYSDAVFRDIPSIIPPRMVAPDLDVPGISASTWKRPIMRAVDQSI